MSGLQMVLISRDLEWTPRPAQVLAPNLSSILALRKPTVQQTCLVQTGLADKLILKWQTNPSLPYQWQAKLIGMAEPR